jgi:hypothetical protein
MELYEEYGIKGYQYSEECQAKIKGFQQFVEIASMFREPISVAEISQKLGVDGDIVWKIASSLRKNGLIKYCYTRWKYKEKIIPAKVKDRIILRDCSRFSGFRRYKLTEKGEQLFRPEKLRILAILTGVLDVYP